MSQAIQKRQDDGRQMIRQATEYLNTQADKLVQWCENSDVEPRQLIRLAQLTIQQNEKLHNPKSWPSVFMSLIQAAQLGLEPNGFMGDGWIIPRWDKNAKCNLATFQPGYKGLIKLLRRSGEIKLMRAHVVLEGDEFEAVLDTARGDAVYQVRHVPNIKDRGTEIVAAFSVAYFTDDRPPDVEIVDRASIDKARKAGHGDTPAWKSWPDQMARKVAIRRHCNQLPMSPKSRRALEFDAAVDIGDWQRASALTREETGDPEEYIDVPDGAGGGAPQLVSAPANEQTASSPATEKLKEKVRSRRTKKKTETPPAEQPEIPSVEEQQAAEIEYLRSQIEQGNVTQEIYEQVKSLEDAKAMYELLKMIEEHEKRVKGGEE